MSLRTPPLHAVHDERGAMFTEFGGWDMPVEFDSITEEHRAVRESVGKFDVSHMGEIVVTGPDAAELTGRLVTEDVRSLEVGGVAYAAITDEDGIVLDDTVVYRQDDRRYLFVPNAGHDGEMYERWTSHRDRWDLEAEVDNRTEELAMFAIQGPEAVELVGSVSGDGDHIAELSWFSAADVDLAGVECWVSRTGYTGEDGFEAILPTADAERVWRELDCQPCGLGARDTLRLEAGHLLSGQDFHPEDLPRTPYEAGIGFVVDLGREFVGREALQRQDRAGVDRTLVGLRLIDRGVARNGYEITDDGGERIGQVTSGTMSPTLGYPIALGYVPVEYAEPGTELGVTVRGESKKAKVVPTPFLGEDQ